MTGPKLGRYKTIKLEPTPVSYILSLRRRGDS
jgi:hypothetical protein